MILLIITNVLYALGYPLSKIALDDSQPLFLIGLRMLVGGIILVSYQVLIKKNTIRFSRTLLCTVVASGIFGMYLADAFSMWGLQVVSATRAAFVENLGPIMSAVLEWLIFKDTFTLIEWLGIVIATIGTMPILGSTVDSVVYHQAGFALGRGDLFIILSDIMGVYAFILTRKLASQEDYNPVLVNGIAMLASGVCALAHSALSESWNPIPTHNIIGMLINTALMLVIYNLIVDNLYNHLARHYTVTALMLSGFTVPLFTVFFDWLFFDLAVPHVFWISALFICVGLFCALKKLRKTKVAQGNLV